MTRIAVPVGYTSWNAYIEAQANAATPQTIEHRRLVKRNIKLGMEAAIDKQAGGNTLAPNYRPYNVYTTPGTVSPATGHPWTTS
jgi:hypothetical protein